MTGPINKQMRSKDEMLESESFAHKVLDASLNGIYIYDVKLGKNVFINTQYTTLTGYDFNDLKAMDKAQFFELIHPDDRLRMGEHMEKLVRGINDMLEIEYRFKAKDGRWVRYLSNEKVLTRDEDGSASQIIGTFLDITNRKKSELELRESEEKFSKAFYSSPTFLFICELETGIFVEVNDAYCELIGYTREEMIGHSSLELGIISPGNRLKILQRFRKTGRMQNVELKIVTKTGRIKLCLFSAETMEYRNRHCLVYSGFDITERKKAEEVLKEYHRRLEKEVKERTAEIKKQYRELEELNLFIKDMLQHTVKAMENERKKLSKEIHDSIGGSLAAIKMLLESRLLHSDQLPPDGYMSLEKIVGHLNELIEESRRISYQMRPLALEDFSFDTAISEAVRTFKEFYPNIEVGLRVHISDNGIHEEIKTVLYRVIQEALNNVGKHSRADFAKIELVESEDSIFLKVIDNGCGFDASETNDIDRVPQGYGMRSMKERIEICKGTFRVDSEPGKGTVLSVSIPKFAHVKKKQQHRKRTGNRQRSRKKV